MASCPENSANIQQPLLIDSKIKQESGNQMTGEEFESIPQCMAVDQPVFNNSSGSGIKSGTEAEVSALDMERLSKSVKQVHSAVVKRLDDFHSILLNPPFKPQIMTSVGLLPVPLGSTRLEVIHLIRALVQSNNPEINLKLYQVKIASLFLDLFFQYPFNNFLHTQVEQTIRCIFNNIKKSSPVTTPFGAEDLKDCQLSGFVTPGDGDKPEAAAVLVLKSLFEESKIISRILDVWKENHPEATEESNGSTKVKVRPGYMGHLLKIANHVVDTGTEDVVKELLEKDDRYEDWNCFVNGTLTETNKRLTTPLVAMDPCGNSYEEQNKKSELQQVCWWPLV